MTRNNTNDRLKHVYVYDKWIHAPELAVGERVEVVRGNDPREGESMGFGLRTANGLELNIGDRDRESDDGRR